MDSRVAYAWLLLRRSLERFNIGRHVLDVLIGEGRRREFRHRWFGVFDKRRHFHLTSSGGLAPEWRTHATFAGLAVACVAVLSVEDFAAASPCVVAAIGGSVRRLFLTATIFGSSLVKPVVRMTILARRSPPKTCRARCFQR